VGVIVFDQIPRNIFRNQSKSFEYDSRALWIASAAVDRGYHLQLSDEEKKTLLLPFLHSEVLEILQKGVELYSFHSPFQDFCVKNYEIVQQFGRIPYRNEILGRQSTYEELEFLSHLAKR
jgi:uncharacterized protein (DUF924 family)